MLVNAFLSVLWDHILSQEEIWGCHMSMGCKTLPSLCDQDKNSAVISSENFKKCLLGKFYIIMIWVIVMLKSICIRSYGITTDLL